LKRAALKPAIGLLVGLSCLAMPMPVMAHGAASDDAGTLSRPIPGGGGGFGRMARADKTGGGHKHFSLVTQPYWNMSQDAIYTLFGMEMLRQDSLGWKGGFGMYGGMNFGVTSQSNTFNYGGGIIGKDFTAGPLSLTTGVLLGFGKTANYLPAVLPAGVNNVYLFGVGAPRVGLAWTVYRRMEIGLDASYLFATNPNVGQGPALSLRLSSISWGGRGMHCR